MMHVASVDSRKGRLVVASWSRTEGAYPLTILDDWAEAAVELVDDELLGISVRSALAASREAVLCSDLRNNPDLDRRRTQLLKLVGARSESAYNRDNLHVSIRWDDAEQEITLTPTRAGGHGFSGLIDQEFTISATIDNAGLGAAVRQAIASSVSIGI